MEKPKKYPKTLDSKTLNYDPHDLDIYCEGYNQAIDSYETYHTAVLEKLIKRLKDIQKKLPPRDKQKKNVVELLRNWKEHITAIDKLIQEIEKEEL